MRIGRGLALLALVVLIPASLAPKFLRYGGQAVNLDVAFELAVVATLTPQGYTGQGAQDLVNSGAATAIWLTYPDCRDPLIIEVMSGSAEDQGFLPRLLPASRYQVEYEYRGTVSTTPPLYRYLLVEAATEIGRLIALPVGAAQPMLAIGKPLHCTMPLRWPALLANP